MLTTLLFTAQVATLTPNAAADSQCIGHPVAACISAIKSVYSIDDGQIARDLAALDRMVIDRLAASSRRVFILSVRLPVRQAPQTLEIDFDKDKIVTIVRIGIEGDPVQAQTPAEYERTSLAEAISVILPASCWNGVRANFYRFFQERVKPEIIKGEKVALGNYLAYLDRSPPIPFCGYRLEFRSLLSNLPDNDIAQASKAVSRRTMMIVQR